LPARHGNRDLPGRINCQRHQTFQGSGRRNDPAAAAPIRMPLERTARWEQGEVPETYPFAV
jgi:hypothetical protein